MAGRIIFIAGKGGTGKDTIASEVAKRLCLRQLPIHATRELRDNEHNDGIHIFNTKEEILSKIPDGYNWKKLGKIDTIVVPYVVEVRRYTHSNGLAYYATYYSDAPDYDVIAVGPSEMFYSMKELFGDKAVIGIELTANKNVRLDRMGYRNNPVEANRRVSADDDEWMKLPETTIKIHVYKIEIGLGFCKEKCYTGKWILEKPRIGGNIRE